MYDYSIIGGGIIGLSTAMALTKRFPAAKIIVVEKENGWAHHQTGHNSGVVHSGIYYKPGSLKAKFAKEGNAAIAAFCKEHGIAYERCGKVIVATEERELPHLDELLKRGIRNGLEVERIDGQRLKEIEPHVNGIAAIRVPSCGITDYKEIANTFARLIEKAGGTLQLGITVESISETDSEVVLETNKGTIRSKYMINCAGLQSDRMTKVAGIQTDVKIVPFRGEYYELVPEKRHLVNHLIYPVPNPDFPFLGVHFTRMANGEVHAGPNAVLAFKREGYTKKDFNVKDMMEVLRFRGFWKMAVPNMKEGMKEYIRSYSKQAFLKSLQRLIPELTLDDIKATHAGVRAQAILDDGNMVDDFLIVPGKRSLHICNAPSPAATASISIGQEIADRAESMFDYHPPILHV